MESPYRGWSQRLRPAWMACLPLATNGVRLIVRKKLFWLLLALAALNFLFAFATIYLKAQVSAENPAISQFVDRVLTSMTGEGKSFRDFMFAQGTVTMLLLAFAGELLVGGDYRHGGLTFYLSRRIARRHYVIGKLLSISLVVSLTTTVPALILYAEYGLLTDSTSYFRENWRIAVGIVGYGALMALVLSLLLFALASWFPRTVPLVMCWACVFVLLPALGALLREVFDDRRWQLLMLWRNIRLLGSWCFGAVTAERDLLLLPWAVAVVAGVSVVCLLAVLPRVRR
ncbi:MAG: ABC transporter permease subunit [Pirellulaceae bacterium]|nr:ABC transporter permease subunit [Pirellulaceae bacterium]